VSDVNRRETLKLIAAAGGAAAAAGCVDHPRAAPPGAAGRVDGADAVLALTPLGFPWPTTDPFLFCAHHDDHYPAGNDRLGPAAPLLIGRNIGSDFDTRESWRMYHGATVPGFPQHPHRGFETVTVVRRGLLDHSDSLGAAARYGGGDVQWLTAGRGILHAEMFPLVRPDTANPLELFQIWLNLPSAHKMVDPYFSMLWSPTVPRHVALDGDGNPTEITVVAGRIGDARAPAPPPRSWAAGGDADVAIWTIRMAPGARWTLPAAQSGSQRSLYYFRGRGLHIGGRAVAENHRVELRPDTDVTLAAGFDESELLLLQGRPIGEPIVKYGPFVMTSEAEIRQAITDYQRTRFGGWPWPADDPVRPRDQGRFARLIDGRVVRPEG
jgi:redox-sensitive bicupin YhaK (pirin superfamily)